MIAILLLGFGLRVAPWASNRFLEDEALYSYWGLQIATGADLMLASEPVDKPPLHPYTLALSFLLFGATPPSVNGQVSSDMKPATATAVTILAVAPMRQLELAARLPSLISSVVGIAIVYSLGSRLFSDARAGLLAAGLLAISPFDILFASTAFTDPLMTTLVLGALRAATTTQLGVAGLLAGLAAAAKPQALLFVPLIVAITETRGSAPSRRPSWLRFGLGLVAVIAASALWDLARAKEPGLVRQGWASYGGLGLVRLSELPARGAAWLRYLGSFWASPWFIGLLMLAMLVWATMGVRMHLGRRPPAARMAALVQPRASASRRQRLWPSVPILLAAFVLGFLALHWFVSFQVWDRYLLGLVPLVALLGAGALVFLEKLIHSGAGRRLYFVLLSVFLLAALSAPAVHAAQNRLAVGGDHGAYDGIDELASYVATQAPPDAVLYDYWLGYHYRFYLYGKPLRIHWYPDVSDLVRDAIVYRRAPRFIAFPSWRDSSHAKEALASAGIRLAPIFQTRRRDGSTSFHLFRLEGP